MRPIKEKEIFGTLKCSANVWEFDAQYLVIIRDVVLRRPNTVQPGEVGEGAGAGPLLNLETPTSVGYPLLN